jgi:peptidoglycan/LPS O-acetylase OafA/YrhL
VEGMAGTRLTHMPALDGLRGLAAVAIVLFHAWPAGVPGGWVAVDVFFALSGFLITGILTAEWRDTGRVGFRRFYARRARRLGPALVLTVVVLVAAGMVSAWQAVAALAYVGNWVLAAGGDMGPLTHAWSLAIEEQFYLLWPLVLVGLLRWRGAESAGRVALGVVAAMAAVRVGVVVVGLDGDWVRQAPITHADGFLVGAAVALLPRVRWERLAPVAALLVVVPFLPVLPGTLPGHLLYPLLAVASAGCVARCAAGFRPLEWAPLRATGRISYGIYLIHPAVLTLLYQVGVPTKNLPFAVLALAVSWSLAALSYELVESRFRQGTSSTSMVRDQCISSPLAHVHGDVEFTGTEAESGMSSNDWAPESILATPVR